MFPTCGSDKDICFFAIVRLCDVLFVLCMIYLLFFINIVDNVNYYNIDIVFFTPNSAFGRGPARMFYNAIEKLDMV